MQPQIILTSLLVGIAYAMPQGFVFPDDEFAECDEGIAVDGPQGRVCIGSHNEKLGPAKVQGQAPDVAQLKNDCPKQACSRLCDLIVRPDGCEVCPPECVVGNPQ